MTFKRILVTGATGKQGGSVVRALVRTNALKPASPAFHVLAMTRDAESSSARKFALLPNVTVVVGDLDHLEPLFVKIATYGKLDAVFSVQTVSSGEERQGNALVDAALKAGVHHFIYSSVDIGTFSVNETVGVPHFDSKRRVELHLRASGLPYTILRPVAFMDNFLDPNIASVLGTLLRDKVRPTVPLKVIATSDIGEFAAIALQNPSVYLGQMLSIAGDSLTYGEIDAVFRAVQGKPLPTTYSLVGTVLNLLIKDLRTMVAFFDQVGYSANVEQSRKIYPELKTLKQYLEANQ